MKETKLKDTNRAERAALKLEREIARLSARLGHPDKSTVNTADAVAQATGPATSAKRSTLRWDVEEDRKTFALLKQCTKQRATQQKRKKTPKRATKTGKHSMATVAAAATAAAAAGAAGPGVGGKRRGRQRMTSNRGKEERRRTTLTDDDDNGDGGGGDSQDNTSTSGKEVSDSSSSTTSSSSSGDGARAQKRRRRKNNARGRCAPVHVSLVKWVDERYTLRKSTMSVLGVIDQTTTECFVCPVVQLMNRPAADR